LSANIQQERQIAKYKSIFREKITIFLNINNNSLLKSSQNRQKLKLVPGEIMTHAARHYGSLICHLGSVSIKICCKSLWIQENMLPLQHVRGKIRAKRKAFAYSKDVLEVWPQIDASYRIMQMSTYVDV